MKIYWHQGNIPGFFVGVFAVCASLYVYITGKSGGLIFHSKGLEAYINASMFLLFGVYLISRIFWDKKDRDFTLIEGFFLFCWIILCEILPHVIVRYLR